MQEDALLEMSNRAARMEEAVEKAISKAEERHRVNKEALEVGWIPIGGR